MAGTTPPLPDHHHTTNGGPPTYIPIPNPPAPNHSVHTNGELKPITKTETTPLPTLPPTNGDSHRSPYHLPKSHNHNHHTNGHHHAHNNNHNHHHAHHAHDAPQRVLLLVAVQQAMLAPRPTGVPSAPTVGPNISSILTRARSSAHPPLIIHVRNNGDIGDPDEKDSPGWELVHAPLPSEPIIDKLKNNAFAGTKLGELIRDDAEVIVAGMQSDFCIRATCSAALARGNEVLLIREAHATYDRLEAFHVGTVTPASTVEKEIEDELEEAGVILLDMTDVPSIFDNR
ncbi:hypothetical protein NLI96_g4978 [Meripilus lineatus]|uniref:Isochorismatase-like domain-containing protein n=1 Tax=Meripilus lineatus TaxID=2056292 RepID=A0AAD5V3T1_9APHY|nr:hypothetical protein NLI96_g4978 [Physisporinus lineatus]